MDGCLLIMVCCAWCLRLTKERIVFQADFFILQAVLWLCVSSHRLLILGTVLCQGIRHQLGCAWVLTWQYDGTVRLYNMAFIQAMLVSCLDAQ